MMMMMMMMVSPLLGAASQFCYTMLQCEERHFRLGRSNSITSVAPFSSCSYFLMFPFPHFSISHVPFYASHKHWKVKVTIVLEPNRSPYASEKSSVFFTSTNTTALSVHTHVKPNHQNDAYVQPQRRKAAQLFKMWEVTWPDRRSEKAHGHPQQRKEFNLSPMPEVILPCR